MRDPAKRHPTVEETLERLRDLRLRRERGPMLSAFGYRRAEDRYRDEYRDERAIVLNPRATAADGVVRPADRFRSRPSDTIRIRMIKRPPAPLMDGFDVDGLRMDRVYDVDARTGRYLIIARYARLVTEHRHGDR